MDLMLAVMRDPHVAFSEKKADARGAAKVRRYEPGMPSLQRSLPKLVGEMSSSGLVMLLIDSRPVAHPNSC